MKRILVIDESQLFRDFLRQKLEDYGFEVTVAVNGLDGSVKLRKETPDLVIMDYYLTRNSSVELLEKKRNDPNAAEVPVIMASSRIDREKLLEVAKYGVKKFFNKPIRVDALLNTISELLGVKLELDNTPCIIEAHVNDDILFIEVSQGLNNEKIELLRYKITELLQLHDIRQPKVLLMMVGLDVTSADSLKLGALLNVVMEYSQAKQRNVKILTNTEYVRQYIEEQGQLSEVEVTDSLEQAMEGLLGRRSGSYMQKDGKSAQTEFLTATQPKKEQEETFHMQFDAERGSSFDLAELDQSIRIAVVDDDMVIQELIKTAFSDTRIQIQTFDDGQAFLHDEAGLESDLVFLDILMPEMNGFQVLEAVRQRGIEIPIIVLSALSQRDSVVKAVQYGVKSYLIKPLEPEAIRKKAAEVLRVNF
jgi:DNA-binding response OmpR family regulator